MSLTTEIYCSTVFTNLTSFSLNYVDENFSSPLPAAFDRIIQVTYDALWSPYSVKPLAIISNFSDNSMQVGDASAIQSPVSFGGFGSMTRHLSRLSNGMFGSDYNMCNFEI